MLGFLLLFSAQAVEPPDADFRAVVEEYRNGNTSRAALTLHSIEPKRLSAESVEFLAGLDLKRPADRGRLLAATLLLAESALLLPSPDVRDVFFDEAVKLTTAMEQEEGIALQKDIHLAASYRLFHERRVMDALHVLEPAVSRYPSDPSLQFGLGTLLELGGWLESSPGLLEKARGAYEAVLVLEPGNSRAALRLGRVLGLLRRTEDAVPRLRAALLAELSVPERVVGLLSLGDALRDRSLDEALGLYREALNLDPSSQAARVALSYALRVGGRVDEARETLEPSFAPTTDIPGPDSFQRYLMADSVSHDERWRALRGRLR